MPAGAWLYMELKNTFLKQMKCSIWARLSESFGRNNIKKIKLLDDGEGGKPILCPGVGNLLQQQAVFWVQE